MPFFKISSYNDTLVTVSEGIASPDRFFSLFPVVYKNFQGPRFRFLDKELEEKMKKFYSFEKDPQYLTSYNYLKIHLANHFQKKGIKKKISEERIVIPSFITQQIFSYLSIKDINWWGYQKRQQNLPE